MQSEAALEKSSRSSPGEAVMAAVYDNRYAVLAAAAMALAGLVFLRRHNRASAMRRRLAGMQDERASLQRLIAGLQEKYFVGSGIGKLDYDESMAKYVKRLTVLEKDIALLKENA
jgi:hypothetical protein